MEVHLLSMTDDPIRRMYLGAKRCVTSGTTFNFADASYQEMTRVVEKCLNSGHLTVAEFVEMTFEVSGCDLNTVMQYLRHRHFSTLQRSGRHVVIGTDDEMKSLDTAFENSDTETIVKIVSKYFKVPYGCIMQAAECLRSYHEAINHGVPVEDARRILPQGELTEFHVHCNFRALIEASRLRLCAKAQQEVRDLFMGFKHEVMLLGKNGMFMSQFIVPKCLVNGRCNESKSCGYLDGFNAKKEKCSG